MLRKCSISFRVFNSMQQFNQICQQLFGLKTDTALFLADRIEFWIDENNGMNIGLISVEGELISQIHIKGKVGQKNEKNCGIG